MRRVIVALEPGRDIDVNMLLDREPKSLATLDGSRILVPFYKEIYVRAKCPSAPVKHALLLMKWRLFSPSLTLQEQKASSSCHFPFFEQLYKG